MTSVFGIDLATMRQAPGHCGPAHGPAATALFRALADHYELPVDHVRVALTPMFPDALQHLQSPAGWALFGAYMAAEMPHASPYEPAVH